MFDLFGPWIDKDYKGDRAKEGEERLMNYDSDAAKWVESLDGAGTYVVVGGVEHYLPPMKVTFIKSLVTDNPHLGKDYLATLNQLPKHLREPMLHGDFSGGIEDRESQLIPTAWIEEAMDRWDENDSRSTHDMDAMGIDTARGGLDNNAFSRRHGYWWDKIKTVPGKNTLSGHDCVSYIAGLVRGRPKLCIDLNGNNGESTFDLLVKNYDAHGVKGQASKNIPKVGKLQPSNIRTALYVVLKNILNPDNNFKPSLPRCPRLKAGLMAVNFYIGDSNKIFVEKKDELKKRLGYSPDEADAVVYSLFWHYMNNCLPQQSKFGYGHNSGEIDKRALYADTARQMNGGNKRNWIRNI